ncbi:hypothetical protein FQN54_001148 [Arachnomyces sp. PD_36]|nr:hypothetical protein FQN54_001148 [Arachnomyces sp. PD_36]
MAHFTWKTALVACFLGTQSFAAELEALATREPRRLSAATVPANSNARRSESGLFRREASFDFVEEGEGGTSFVSTVTVRSQQPILPLEDIDSHLSDISCSDSLIELSFGSIEGLQAAKEELSQFSDFIAVTSHPGCNEDGERVSHKVNKVTIDDTSGVVSLSSAPCEWREAFPSMDVAFGRRDSSQVQKRGTLTKRQSQQGPETTNEPKVTQTREYPPTPTDTTGLPQNATDDISKSFIGTALMPPDHPAAGLFIPQGVTLSCNNCTIAGDIDISQGSFSVSKASDDNFVEELDDVIDDIVDFFTNGTVEVIAKSLFTHIELGVNITSPEEVPFTASLPPIPLTPFAIPGIVAFGPMIVPEFTLSFSTSASANFSYGFNISVPDGSSFALNVSEISNSTMQGFDETTINALPFQSDIEIEKAITFSVSFSPQILLGVSTAAGVAKGGIGAFFDLPKLSVEIAQLDHVDEECNPLPEKEESADDDLEEILSLGNFTSISPSVEFNFGVFAELDLSVGTVGPKIEPQHVLINKVLELPGACLGYDGDTGTYQSAANIVAKEREDDSDSGDGNGDGSDDKEGSATWSGEGVSAAWKLGLLTFAIFLGL